ncbi:spermidine synthase [Loa loa]|uniref:Spermidine synthase n=1 Tax=Loa loa TaxID=7209 RepID=A0A1S0UBZ6_LOALO|nr:spermidine synthase [Loa loa]EFO27473.2 spermidine synthase [Loa loa]
MFCVFEAKLATNKLDDLDSFHNHIWSGQAFSLKVDEVLAHERSKYQDILIFKSSTHGNVLVLDGVIQYTEHDEFAYQEMITHLAMFSHPLPRKVLVIGGGDGAVLREVLKHDCVESVTMCEIDETVINLSKKFLPQMSFVFSSPKLKLAIQDGFDFVKEHKEEFDVVITDSSDPIGPATKLFSETYYGLIKETLTERGVLSSQGECPWLDIKFIRNLVKHASALYPRVAYAVGFVPTYPSGQIGYLLCSKDENLDLTIPRKILSDSEIKRMDLKYYNSDIHRSAFILPQFIKEALYI